MFSSNVSADAKTIRNHNRSLIFRQIEKNNGISRAELARKTNISEPTVSSIVENFLSKNLIEETGLGESLGGRRPVLLNFNPEVAYVLGIDVGGENLRLGITDLDGNFVIKKEMANDIVASGKQAITRIVSLIEEIIEESRLSASRIKQIGVVVPGVTDPYRGIVSYAPAINWNNFNLKELLQKELEMSVILENNVNAAAFAEKKIGVARDFNDFCYINMGTGFGAGLIINNSLYRGKAFKAGEVAYMIVERDWIKDEGVITEADFANLDKIISGLGLIKKIKEKGLVNKFDKKSNFQKKDKVDIDLLMKQIIYLVKKGDKEITELYNEFIDYLAAVIINISMVINPPVVVLGGSLVPGGDYLLDTLKNKIKSSSPLNLEVLFSSLDLETGLIGSIMIAAQKIKEELILR